MNLTTLKPVLDEFKNKRVLVIGDYYLDEYINGTSTKVSPEAPVLRMTVKQKEFVPGAAANVAVGFAAAGALVYAGGIIGNDHYGEILRNSLLEKRVITKGLIPVMDRNTGVFSRITLETQGNMKQHIIRFDVENETGPSVDFYKKFKEFISEIIDSIDLIYVADYDESPDKTGLITLELISFIIEQASLKNVMTVGSSRQNIIGLKGFDILFLNQKEAEEASKKVVKSTEDFLSIGEELHTLFQNKITVVTRSKEGLAIIRGKEIVTLPSLAKKVVDVCGCGDSLSVAFSLALLSGANLTEAGTIGSSAASVAISKVGTVAVTLDEISENLSSKSSFGNHKIKSAQELIKKVQELKKENKKIVFTNGHFDLFHSGHVQLLEKAKEKGDCLIVGINSDRSVRENKGTGRPILGEFERLKILSALECVDYITVFDELTPIRLLSTIKPHVLVKGGNYKKEEVVGKDIVESYGGTIETISLPASMNADKIIEMITENKLRNENP